MERVIGRLLRFGVLFSSSIVLLGAICLLHRHGHEPASFHEFRPAPPAYRAVRGTIESALRMDCRGVIQLGLLFLIATPIARVAFSLFAFAAERDWIYVGFTSFVLVVLIFSLLLER